MYKVILVDDEYMILSGLEKLINWEHLRVECVAKLSNGQEALDYVKENPVDIVITDVSMPRLDGIEFVKKSQKIDINFNFIILSGYQEFEYVKEGINLGAENFLLKPIDAQELNDTIEKTVQKLDAEKIHLESEEVLFRNTMIRWVNAEIDIIDLRRVMKELGYRFQTEGLYSTLIIGGIDNNRKKLWSQTLDDLNQKYYYFDEDLLIGVIEGGRLEFEKVRREIVYSTINSDEIIGLGELFVTLEDVHKSYNHAESMINTAKFYGSNSLGNQENLIKEMKKDKDFHAVSFEKFHHALSIGDEKLITQEIKNLLEQTIEMNADPEYVRYLSFIIFSDIYRQHENYDDREYHVQLQSLSTSESINNIELILKEALDANLAYAEVKQYNVNVQKTLEIIYKNFDKDINITSIAEELHLNAMYLGQIFKKETGISFSQYLNRFRIKQAQKLLLHSNHNVNEIAELVGYASSGYFYKNFKKECGISPREYQDRYVDQGEILKT